MPTQYRLHIKIDETRAPEGAVGLLVPVPPTTPHQKLTALAVDPAWSTLAVTAQSGVQSAIFATFPGGAQRSPIDMTMIDCGSLEEAHFTSTACASRHAAVDAVQLGCELGLSESRNDIDSLEKIVGSLARKFNYQSGYKNDAPLTCDILTGNCLSINEAFLNMTKVADIQAAYYIGYFFEPVYPLFANDWHCWVSTLTTRGYESWDIAHHLKRGLKNISPGLNPVPGVRFAMSVGRDLIFGLPFAEVNVPHLCEPRWVFKDGTSARCAVQISVDVSAGVSVDAPVNALAKPAVEAPHVLATATV